MWPPHERDCKVSSSSLEKVFVPAGGAPPRSRRHPGDFFFLSAEFIKCHVGCFAQRALCFEKSAALRFVLREKMIGVC